ncbi:radical SAM protein [bacterium]|nr:radical SAM protein [bacterium]
MYYSKPAVTEEIDNYLKKLIEEIHFFKKTFSNVEFSSLYIGGGTPSILTTRQINKLFSNLFNSFKFRNDGEKNFECNPESITLEKLKLLKKFGFNRVSFGVQNLDKKILIYANRNYQNYNLIKNAVKNAKFLGLEVNVDLMVGIKGDSVKSIVKSFIRLAKIKPDSITLYSFKPLEEYLKKYFNNNYYSFNYGLYKKAKKVRQILNSMKNKLNYRILIEKFDIPTAAEPTFYFKGFKAHYTLDYDYNFSVNYQRSSSLFGLGTRASSYIFKSLQYHDQAIGKEGKNFNPKERSFWAMKFNLKDEMIYFILQRLSCILCFSQQEFRNFFNSGFKANFKDAISSLKKLGKIKFHGDLVFFPADPLERYTSALFFFNEGKVVKKINDFLRDIKVNVY